MRKIASAIVIWCVGTTLLSPQRAHAQNMVGRAWSDQVANAPVQLEGPLPTQPLAVNFAVGGLYTLNDNIFLAPQDKTADSVVVPFGRVRLVYSEEQLDVAADALINYNRYFSKGDSSSDEERLFLRGAYIGSNVALEIAEMFRRESDPISGVFDQRVNRSVNDLAPRVTVHFDPVAVEVGAGLQVVVFEQDELKLSDNLNYRIDGLLGVEMNNGLQLVAGGGYLGINYTKDSIIDPTDPTKTRTLSGTPNATGFFARGGIRGALFPALSMSVIGGVTSAESDKDAAGSSVKKTTADVDVSLRLEATDAMVWIVSYGRHIGFGGGGTSSFGIVNSGLALVEYAVLPSFILQGRGQLDHVTPTGSGAVSRDFFSLGAAFVYQLSAHVELEGGPIYRRSTSASTTENSPGDYDNFVLQMGVAATF